MNKNGTSSESTGDGNVMEQVYGGGTNVPKPNKKPTQSNVVSSGITAVADTIGLVDKKAGPMDYLQTGPTTGTYSVQGGQINDMYGGAASKATDDFLVEQGSDYATAGNYFRQEGGNFIRISKQEGKRLYAKGDPSISRSINITKKGQEVKYGMSGGAMGSGDPTGIMSSTAISQPMFESQKRLKQMIGLGMVAMGAPMAGQVVYNASKKPYNEYLKSFYNIQSSTSIASTSSQPVSSGTYLAEKYGTDDTSGSQDEGTQYDADTTVKKRQARSLAGGVDLGRYNLFAKTNQSISGSMSS